MNKIRVWKQDHLHTITAKPGESVLYMLSSHGYKIPAPCAGNGTCGKCAVNTSHGMKLACQTQVADGIEIYLPNSDDAAMAINSTYETIRPFICDRNGKYGIAIDIGTTTLAIELIDMSTGQKIFTHSAVNSQRTLGADVITRIKQATQGAQAQLHSYIIEDIRRGIAHIIGKSGLSSYDVSFVSIAGNTTMLHLLQNMPCDSLGAFPFTPVDISIKCCNFTDIFGEGLLDAELLIIPGISTFVGADIVAGILCCHSPYDTAPNLLIDLGTNGEMTLFTHEKLLVTSTAAGPAFEAGNISRGTASVPGAIAKVRFSPENNVFIYETIENQPPIGICGTGVLDIAAELVRHNLADETGRLEDENGAIITEDIVFAQQDMREIQLAKSALRSGLEILLDVAGYSYNDVGKVYLAGGFGHKINMDSAVVLGLIPSVLKEKIVVMGNTALGGAAHVLLSQAAETDAIALATRAQEINLSVHPRFNDLFMEHMMFE